MSAGGDRGDDGSIADDVRATVVYDTYRAQLASGLPPDWGRLLAEHPSIAERLRMLGRAESLFTPDAAEPMPTLAGYRIVRELGRGGMGIVYEAEPISGPSRVAIKVGSRLGTDKIAR